MSIFKDSFTPSISASLDIRQKAMLKRDAKSIQYLNSRNAWVRMTSSVNVNGTSDLANEYVLLGGIINKNGTPKAGIGDWTKAYSNTSAEGNSYRLGIRPMPGITGVDVKSKGAYGSLREVQVNFQCWDIKQLEDLELLYMRPGYTILIEWGWAPFLNNEGNIEYNVNFYDDVLKGKATKEQVWKDIYNKANTNGNYDAMFGYIKNYSWSARPDGGYDCQTSIISIGEIIESLKVNYSPFDNNRDIINKGIFLPAIGKNPSQYITASNGIVNDIPPEVVNNFINNNITGVYTNYATYQALEVNKNELTKTYYTKNILCGIFYELYQIGRYTTGKTNENTTQDEGVHLTLEDPNKPGSYYDLFHKTININSEAEKVTGDNVIGKSDEQVYIRLGSLIDLLNNHVSLKDTNSNISLCELSVKEREYDKKSIPTVATIGAGATVGATGGAKTGTEDQDNYLKALSHPLEISVDPRICLIKNPLYIRGFNINTSNAPTDNKNINVEDINKANKEAATNLSFLDNIKYSYFVDNKETKLGIIANIYVNLNFLYNLASDNAIESQDKKEKNEISLYDFLKNMTSQISPCLGNINNFDIFVDPIDNKARIIDINYVDSTKQNDAYINAFQLEIQNLKSTVRTYKLESQIFPDQSTTVAIGAQVQGGPLGTNVNTLIDFNKNITDRILANKATPTSFPPSQATTIAAQIGAEGGLPKSNASSPENILLQNFSILSTFLLDLKHNTEDNDADFDADKADSYKGALRDIMGYFQSIEKSDQTNRAIIPTKLSIEMDGIGGLIIGHLFRIPDDLLPRGYKGLNGVGSRLGYLITGIGHSIQNNDWITKIDAQTIILDEPQGGIAIDYSNITINLLNDTSPSPVSNPPPSDPGPNVEAKNIPYSVDQIIKTMNSLNYEVKTTPWYVNVVGIRNKYKQPGIQATDKFIDYMIMWYVDDKGQRFERKSIITTTAGPSFYTGRVIDSFNELVPGQYKDGWELGIHSRNNPSYPALVERTPIKIWRPDIKDGKYKLSGNVISTTPGDNIHRASIGGSSTIGLNSRGCQVFSQPTELQWLVNAVTQQQTKGVNVKGGRAAVNYTLLKEENIIK